jgi:hypothetical protein
MWLAKVASVTALTVLAAGSVLAAEYRDGNGVFSMAYDEAIWRISPGSDGDFSIACLRETCDGIVAGCSASRLWVPLATVGRLTRGFDAKETERAILEGLGAEKASTDKEKGSVAVADDVAPEVVKPYTLMHIGDGHPVYDSEYRVSLGGRVTRFLSFSTAARSHSIAVVCHVPEDRLPIWRPRFDALIGGFKPAPQPFWLRWLEALGL